jgi:hypothetical protein
MVDPEASLFWVSWQDELREEDELIESTDVRGAEAGDRVGP